MGRIEKKCNKCGLIKNFKLYRKKNNKSGWKDINGGLRYSYCKHCESQRMRERYILNPIPQMLSNSKIRAKKKDLPHNIKSKDMEKIWPKNNKCPVLGNNFDMGYKKGRSKNYAPSLDRIEPKKGYVKDNIIIVSDIVNRMKQDATLDDLKKISEFFINLKK